MESSLFLTIFISGVVETESKEREERLHRELTATKNSYKEALDDIETLKRERTKLVDALTAEKVHIVYFCSETFENKK